MLSHKKRDRDFTVSASGTLQNNTTDVNAHTHIAWDMRFTRVGPKKR